MTEDTGSTFEPEIDADLFDDKDLDFDEDALDEDELEEWDEDDSEEEK